MRFTPVAIFGAQAEFPVSGALYRLEPTLFGDRNPLENGIEISTIGSTEFLSDPTVTDRDWETKIATGVNRILY